MPIGVSGRASADALWVVSGFSRTDGVVSAEADYGTRWHPWTAPLLYRTWELARSVAPKTTAGTRGRPTSSTVVSAPSARRLKASVATAAAGRPTLIPRKITPPDSHKFSTLVSQR